MKTVAVVPMKLNNERLPGKNTKSFQNGKPLFQYILSTLRDVKNIDDIYVYCSNESIKDMLPDGIKYLKRDEKFDTSTTKMNEILKAFSNEVHSDLYVLAHATAPFIKSQSIDEALEKVLSGEYDSAFSVKALHEFLWKDGKPFNYDLAAIPRTQDLEPLYQETSGFYIFNNETINKYNRRIGMNPYLKEVSEIESVDIDNPEDFDIADAIYNMQLNKK
jgi:CMP-N-acetylneuraminic acid synthetase